MIRHQPLSGPLTFTIILPVNTSPDNEQVTYNLRFRLDGKEFQGRMCISAEPMRIADFLPVIQSFSNVLIYAAAQQMEKKGLKITCRIGCNACCRQVIPISESEAVYLAELVKSMPSQKQIEVRRRFQETINKLEESGHLQQSRRIKNLEKVQPEHRLQLEKSRQQIPCPFLENECCMIYPQRPMICREYLVTSPSSHCYDQGQKKIDRVPLPAQLSSILIRLGDGVGKDRMRWLPIELALEWTKQNQPTARKTFAGPYLFENFFRQLCQVEFQNKTGQTS